MVPPRPLLLLLVLLSFLFGSTHLSSPSSNSPRPGPDRHPDRTLAKQAIDASNLATKLHQQGRPAAALAAMRRAVAAGRRVRAPASVPLSALLLNLGTMELSAGAAEAAVASLTESIRRSGSRGGGGGSADAHVNLGAALSELGRTSEATQSYLAGLRADPTHRVARDNLLLALRVGARAGDDGGAGSAGSAGSVGSVGSAETGAGAEDGGGDGVGAQRMLSSARAAGDSSAHAHAPHAHAHSHSPHAPSSPLLTDDPVLFLEQALFGLGEGGEPSSPPASPLERLIAPPSATVPPGQSASSSSSSSSSSALSFVEASSSNTPLNAPLNTPLKAAMVLTEVGALLHVHNRLGEASDRYGGNHIHNIYTL